MDGYRYISIFTVFIALNSQFARADLTTDHACFARCFAHADSKNMEKKFSEFENQANPSTNTPSCPLSESTDPKIQAVSAGALKILQISRQECTLPAEFDQKNQNFLYQVMQVQGLRLSPESKERASDFNPSELYRKLANAHGKKLKNKDAAKDREAFGCFSTVENEKLQPGDILVSKSDSVILDNVNWDPAKIKIDGPHTLENCRAAFSDATDPEKFSLSILSATGRNPFFSKTNPSSRGSTSSVWVTALTERAVERCMGKRSKPVSGPPGVFVLRRSSAASECLFTPELKGAECLKQCCEESK